jgi:hypothetical protein
MKRTIAAIVAALGVLVGVTTADAAWLAAASGAGQSRALGVSLPNNRVATATGATSVHVAWTAPSAPSAAPTQYVVRRKAPTTATVCTVSGTTFACDDTGLAPTTTYTYTIEARIGTAWTSGESATFGATTPAQPTFVVTTAAGTKTAGSAFAVTIRATTNGTTTDTGYTGPHAIAFSGPANSPDGVAPTYPATVNFVAGQGTATVTLVRAETATLVAGDGVRTGSASITVAAAGPSKLFYTNPACASGQVVVGNGGSFTSSIGVADAYGNQTDSTAFVQIVSIGRSPGVGTLSQSVFLLFIGQDQVGPFTFTLPVGPQPDVTLTASAGSLTAAACVVKDA